MKRDASLCSRQETRSPLEDIVLDEKLPAEEEVGFLACKCTLPARVKLLVNHLPQILLLRAALSPVSAQHVFVLRIAPAQMQDLVLGLV